MKKTTINEAKNTNYAIREAFKSLRTNFLFCGTEYKTVLITSCVKNEGKSTISLELSKSLAVSDKRVLLIDADLRKSVFATKYTSNTEEIVGLSEFLSGQAEFDDVIFGTQNKNLDLIFAGAVPPNPVELLGSKKFEELVKSKREEYDYVIIDAAPLGPVIDASVISSVCDGAILVITANYIAQRFALDVKEQLEKSGCKVLGAVLNRIPTKSGSYYTRYYRRYYGKYKKYGHGKYGKYGAYGKYGSTGYEDDTEAKFTTDDEVDSIIEDTSIEEVSVDVLTEPVVEEAITEKKEIKSTPKNVPVKSYPSSKSKGKKKKKK